MIDELSQRERLLAKIKQNVSHGEVVLTSGRHSNYYIGVDNACADDPFLACSVLATHLGVMYLQVCDLIAGPAKGSAPLVFGLATLHRKPAMFTSIVDSTLYNNIGRIYSDHKEILLVDDVVTTGGSLLLVESWIRDKMPRVNIRKICMVNRGDTDIESVYSLDEVLK